MALAHKYIFQDVHTVMCHFYGTINSLNLCKKFQHQHKDKSDAAIFP